MSAPAKAEEEEDDEALALCLELAGPPATGVKAHLSPTRSVREYIAMSEAYSRALAEDAKEKTVYYCARLGEVTPKRSVPRKKEAAPQSVRPRIKQ